MDIDTSCLADIADGTSNTILIGERVGGNAICLKGGRAATDADLAPDTVAQKIGENGGGWGDFLNSDVWIQGALYDGRRGAAGGPCGINCNNIRGDSLYSFHPGGAQFLMCDGSVMPTVSSAFTGPDGEFCISTYESGDGVPAGDYVLTFMWGQKEAFSGSYGGPDKLDNRNLVVNALQASDSRCCSSKASQ